MKYLVLPVLYVYKFVISPMLLPLLGHGCKFHPTCSEYSIDVINKYGIIKGTKLSLERLSKCHSFS